MTGHVRRPAGMQTWQAIYEIGEQSAQRCLGCNKRFWADGRRLKTCPSCGGELKERTERRQGCQSGFPTKKEAQLALNDILASLHHDTYVLPAKITLAEFLKDEWLPAIEHTVRPTTLVGYKCMIAAHLSCGLGATPQKPAIAKGRLQEALHAAAKLPRRQQQKIVEVVEALLKAG